MRIARVIGPRQILLEEAPVSAPGPGEVLVRIKAVGICGSDLHYYAHGRIGEHRLATGHILGHEAAGIVEALGPETEGPAPGTPVAVDPAIHCGWCRFCAAGDPNFCRNLRFFGSPPTPGALREYLTYPGRLVIPLPAGTSLPEGAALEPLGVAIHAVDLGHVAVGHRIAVFGCGPIGLLIARVAQLAGASFVCATEPLAHRRLVAKSFGIATAVDPSRDDVVRQIMDLTGGEGIDIGFEAAGSEPATVQALQVLRPGGALVRVGYWAAARLTLPGITAMRKGLTLRCVRRMKNAFPRAIELARQRLVNFPALITHEFRLADVAEAFSRADLRAPDIVKAVVTL